MAERLAAANTAYNEYLRTYGKNETDSLPLYLAFLAGFQAGTEQTEDDR